MVGMPNVAQHTVLVVEDDRAIREALVECLRDEGYHVVEADDGREALATLNAMARPCLILLDLMMPTMNGWEFRAVQRNEARLADIPVVVMSAFPAGVRTLQDLDVQAYLQKPPRFDRLLDVIERYCGSH
ncbi:MAG: response regulator [Chloroflexota bacterium]|nr:response regulator [Chloroflexota bacterium]